MSIPGGSVDPDHLSPDLAAPPPGADVTPHGATGLGQMPRNLATAVQDVEKDLIAKTLRRTRGNVSETARVLGLTRRGLYLKMRRLGLDGVMADT
jgi:DNA-binding NtrC family response regulator